MTAAVHKMLIGFPCERLGHLQKHYICIQRMTVPCRRVMRRRDEKGTPVGHFLVRKADYEDAEARVGFIVTAPEIRGKGLGKEFAGQILRYVFQVLGMKKVSLAVFDKNTQAKACYEAAGFKAVSHIPDHLEYKGTVYGAYEMEAYSNE